MLHEVCVACRYVCVVCVYELCRGVRVCVRMCVCTCVCRGARVCKHVRACGVCMCTCVPMCVPVCRYVRVCASIATIPILVHTATPNLFITSGGVLRGISHNSLGIQHLLR